MRYILSNIWISLKILLCTKFEIILQSILAMRRKKNTVENAGAKDNKERSSTPLAPTKHSKVIGGLRITRNKNILKMARVCSLAKFIRAERSFFIVFKGQVLEPKCEIG